uniref:RING-type domain-containing protein n=1 Tax=Strigamia maritima TaxID=126957 RepID=T1INQ7_STRMM
MTETNVNNNENHGLRWTLQRNLDPRFHAAAEAPRRLTEDIQQVIRGLSPLVTRSHINLSTWLRHSRNRAATAAPAPVVHTEPTSTLNEFVISVDSAASVEEGVVVGETVDEVQGVTNNNEMPASGAAEDALRQSPELKRLLSVAEKYLPFVLILLAKLTFDHKTGILVLFGLVVTFMHANAVIKREVGRQSKRNLNSLGGVAINLSTCIFFIYYVFESDKLYYSLVFLLPAREHALNFWDLLWIVAISDFVVKLVTILCKAIVILLPAQIIPFQKKGKYFLFIEQTSQLYRSFIPIQPWLCYLLEAYEGLNKIFGVILSVAYVISKGKDVKKKVELWRSALTKLMQSVTYGIKPSKEQLDLTGNMCPICQDDFRHPTMLQCKHIFCEECVIMWFDRERTCPMCRAQIADDPTWRDGATSFFLQFF